MVTDISKQDGGWKIAQEMSEEVVLKHGLLIQETQRFSSKVLSLIYNPLKESFVVLLQGGT